MRLVWLELIGYKRFDSARMNVDGEVIAIVGPNEAGKSSILQALHRLSDLEPLSREEITRGAQVDETDTVIRARFLLEKDDLAAINTIHSAMQARWYVRGKKRDGSLWSTIEPALTRDLEPRRKVLARSQNFQKLKFAKGLPRFEDGSGPGDMLDRSIELLDTIQQTLSEETKALLGRLRLALTGLGADLPPTGRTLVAELEHLLEHEAEKHPTEQARAILQQQRPTFLLFGEEDRTLQSDYDLTSQAADPPSALRNLADLADLDLKEVLKAVQEGEYGTRELLIERANDRLKEVFARAWQQSELTVRLSSDEAQLRLLVSNPGGGYSSIAQRSDGLRAFVALVAYTARYGDAHKPILLIDEAEAHLHYDAQADLVGVFYRQEAASQIVYTTHSAGCLPQDLGTGIRVIAPREGHDRSDIRNAFWLEGPGFSPLLLAMGATTLAFTPSRYAVLAEGPSETIMLPTLLREANNITDLGYQVAPGLAGVAQDAVSLLDLEGAKVAYVVDGDEAGKIVRRKLVDAGVDKDRIVTLGHPRQVGLVLEDLLEPRAYVDAINEEIRRSNGEGFAMPQTAMPATRRPAAITQWCNSKGIGVPSKTAVAARVVDQHRDAKPVSDDGRLVLQRLHQDLVRTLGL